MTDSSRTAQSPIHDDPDDRFTLDFRQILRTILAGWILIAAAIAAVSMLAILYANLASPYYTSTAIVQQKPPDPADVASSPLSRITSGLAGSLLGSSQSPDYLTFFNLLTSATLAQRLTTEHPEILHTIFFWEWDADKKEWIRPTSPVHWAKIVLNNFFAGRRWAPPTSDDLLNYLNTKVNISKDATSGAITISYDDKDSKFAQYLISTMIAETDRIIREEDGKQTNSRIGYLTAELNTKQTDSERNSIIALLSNEYYQDMMLRADRYYVIDIVVPPTLPDLPSWPDAIVLLAIAIFLGGSTGLGIIWLLDARGFDFSKLPRFARAKKRIDASGIADQHRVETS